MARVLLVMMPFTGHVAPMRSIAAELVARGHTVRAYTGSAYAAAFESVGAVHVAWGEAPDFDENDLEATFPDLGNRRGLAQLIANFEQIFVGTAARQLRDLERAWDEDPWDVLVSETTSLGAAFAAERFGSPWIAVSIVPMLLPARDRPPAGFGLAPGSGPIVAVRDGVLRAVSDIGSRRLDGVLARERTAAGLGPSAMRYQDATYSTRLTLATGTPSLDFAPIGRPDWVRYIGRIAPVVEPEPALPAWWSQIENADVPVVLVTQGTFNTNPTDLIRPTLRALDGADVLVVATTGRAGVAFDFPTPSNARVSEFIPFDRLLPLTSLMITNGGWGGTLAGLAAGVPLIIAGGELDKPEIAGRVSFVGAAVNLRTGRPSSAAIARAFGRITTQPSYRQAAERVAAELAQHDGAAEVADAVESLAVSSAT